MTAWVDPEDIMLHENKPGIERQKLHDRTYMWNVKFTLIEIEFLQHGTGTKTDMKTSGTE
jgi:hypothetical protein